MWWSDAEDYDSDDYHDDDVEEKIDGDDSDYENYGDDFEQYSVLWEGILLNPPLASVTIYRSYYGIRGPWLINE